MSFWDFSIHLRMPSYGLGGVNSSNSSKKLKGGVPIALYQKYVLIRQFSDQWEKASEFPEALTSVACCSLHLPNTTLQELTREKYKIANMETDSLEEVNA